MTYIHISMIALTMSAIMLSCARKNEISQVKKELNFSNPPTTIYKTTHDYSIYVPVILSEDKTSILSYPSPKDIYYKNQLALPTQLKSGFYLDNRGVNKNAAFLNITYESYSKLQKVPSLNELYQLILDKNPFTEMYNCGNRYDYNGDEVSALNDLIMHDKLGMCRCLIDKPR